MSADRTATCTHPRFVDREDDGVFWIECVECGMDSHDVERQHRAAGRWVVAANGEPWDGAPGVGIKWVESDA